MPKRSKSLVRWIVPLLVAGVTLGVFWQMQYYGPSSTLRRFLTAVANSDEVLIDATTKEGAKQFVTRRLVGQLQQIMSEKAIEQGARLSQANPGSRPEQQRVVAEVVYIVPSRRLAVTMFFVLEPSGSRWVVNSEESLNYVYRMMNLRSSRAYTNGSESG